MMALQLLEQALCEMASAEVGSCSIYGNVANVQFIAIPSTNICQHQLRHAIANICGDVHVFESRRNVRRCQQAASRMPNPKEGFEARDLAGSQVNLRLVVRNN